ncbi:MAG: hypothetical protein ACE5IR_09750 [bacterium]
MQQGGRCPGLQISDEQRFENIELKLHDRQEESPWQEAEPMNSWTRQAIGCVPRKTTDLSFRRRQDTPI